MRDYVKLEDRNRLNETKKVVVNSILTLGTLSKLRFNILFLGNEQSIEPSLTISIKMPFQNRYLIFYRPESSIHFRQITRHKQRFALLESWHRTALQCPHVESVMAVEEFQTR
jgi:hypothetical protein